MEQLVARRAHNPKVAGSSPAPATRDDGSEFSSEPFSFLPSETLDITELISKIQFVFLVRYRRFLMGQSQLLGIKHKFELICIRKIF